MKFLIVDDEILTLHNMERMMRKLYPDAEIVTADSYKEALSHPNERFSVAFLDIEMPGMKGIELAEKLRETNPRLNVIFVTAYEEHALEAYRLHASGYITKPVMKEDIIQEMENLRYPTVDKVLKVKCFGKFEVFYGNEPAKFERAASKEILAYLIHLRGATAARQDICTALWEDSEEVERRKGYFRSLMASLRKSLKDIEMEEVLITNGNNYAINPQYLDCDYYRYLNGDKSFEVRFFGEYMSQYSWAEEAIEPLIDIRNRYLRE